MLLTPFENDLKSIMAVQKVLIKATCETRLLVSARVAGPTEMTPHENFDKKHACMIGNGVIYVYPSHSFYVTIANFVKNDVNLPRHQNVDEVVNKPLGVVHIKEERYLYPPGCKATTTGRFFNTVRYKTTADLLKHVFR